MVFLVSQSLLLGSVTDYFTIEDPTDEETRDAYLYAAGNCDFPACVYCSNLLSDVSALHQVLCEGSGQEDII